MTTEAVATPLYADSSVLVAALAPDDVHHEAAQQWLVDTQGLLVISAIAEVEVGRALKRRLAPSALHIAANRLLAGCELVDLTGEIRALAVGIAPASVRSLDAVHVATAMAAGAAEFASYDVRQRVAAAEAGLRIAKL